MVSKKNEILKELQKCSEDPVYFIRHYVNIEHPIKGIVPFDLYRFQEKLLGEIESNRFNIIRKFRQAGITTICAAYSLWAIIFKKNHNIMVVSIGDRESTAFLRRVVLMYDDLPKWLQPKITEKNKHALYLSTGSRVKAQPAGAGRGESVSHLIVDEAAFVDKMRDFWAAVYPTIATGGKATLISTVNGMSNLYYELYRDAEKGHNSFNVVDLHWKEHPEYTDEWEKENRPIIGERMWRQEILCQFLGTGDTFIDGNTLQRLHDNTCDEFSTRYSGKLRVYKEADPYHMYVISVDTSFGRDRDYSAFQVLNLYTGEQVAEFYSNTTPVSEFAKIIRSEGDTYNTAHLVIERNGLGVALIQDLFEIQEYENMWLDEKGEFGIQITTKTREVVLSALEEALRASKFKINSDRTVAELMTFVVNDSGKIQADEGYHDDLVMSLAFASFVLEELKDSMPVIPLGSRDENDKDPINTQLRTPIHVSNNDKLDEDISWVLRD